MARRRVIVFDRLATTMTFRMPVAAPAEIALTAYFPGGTATL